MLIDDEGGAVLMDLGSTDHAVYHASTSREAQRLQDDAAERCTMPYRAPELFNVQTEDTVTETTDIWVGNLRLPHMNFQLLRNWVDVFIVVGGFILVKQGLHCLGWLQ